MSISRVGDEEPLMGEQVNSLADARNTVVRFLSGRARMLTELTSGKSAIDGEQESTAKNPQNLIGCDLSGPPWGSAIRHTIAHWGGFQQQGSSRNLMPTTRQIQCTGVAAPDIYRTSTIWRVWNRPFQALSGVSVAPHSRGRVSILAFNSDASTPTLALAVRNLTLRQTYDDGVGGTVSIASGLALNSYDFGATAWVDLVGGWNEIELGFSHTTLDDVVTICGINLYQFAKRSH